MRRKKSSRKMKYLAAAVIAVSIGAFFFLRHDLGKNIGKQMLPIAGQQPAGYKAEDRQKLERLIHQGASDD